MSGSDAGFAGVAERHRRELHVHCYRLLGSFDEAEDLVQETLVRAWRSWESFDGAALRPWLYRIATNACLDFLARRARGEVPSSPSLADLSRLQPYPDRLLDEVDDVDEAVVAKETLALGYLAALQVLTPRQRAVLVLRDIVGWSAGEAAAALGLTVDGVNSSLRRARATLARHRSRDRDEWTAPAAPSAAERALVERFVDACERYDIEAMVALARDDIRMVQLPDGIVIDGRDEFAAATEDGFGPDAPGPLRVVVTRANGRPAVAAYRRPWAGTVYRPFMLSVLHADADGYLVDLVSFETASFAPFGLPDTIEETSATPDE